MIDTTAPIYPAMTPHLNKTGAAIESIVGEINALCCIVRATAPAEKQITAWKRVAKATRAFKAAAILLVALVGELDQTHPPQIGGE